MSNEINTINTNIPAYMQNVEINKTDIDINEMKIPRINIGQLVSEAVKSRKVNYGEIYSTIDENFGKSIELVIVKPFINWVRFDKGEGLSGRSDNGSTWTEGKLVGQAIDPNEAFKYKRYNFYVIRADKPDPIPYIISLYSSSGAKEGNKLYNLIANGMLRQGLPCYAYSYKFSTKEDKNDIGDFCSWIIERKDFSREDVFKIAEQARIFIEKNKDKLSHDEADVSVPAVNPISNIKEDF